VPVFSAPPLPPPSTGVGHNLPPIMGLPPSIRMASPVRIRPAIPVFSSPAQVHASNPVLPVQVKERSFRPAVQVEAPVAVKEIAEKEVSTGLIRVAPASSPLLEIKEDASAAVPSSPVQVQVDTPAAVPSPSSVEAVTGICEESVEKRDDIVKDTALESLKQLEI
jgi:hypothetical protein